MDANATLAKAGRRDDRRQLHLPTETAQSVLPHTARGALHSVSECLVPWSSLLTTNVGTVATFTGVSKRSCAARVREVVAASLNSGFILQGRARTAPARKYRPLCTVVQASRGVCL